MAAAEPAGELEEDDATYTTSPLDLEQLKAIIRDNHLPAEILDSGRTWVRVELTDDQTGLCEVVTMGLSDLVDVILHWREHGCHTHPCSAMIATAKDEAHEPGG